MDIESRLNSFDPQVRKEALLEAKKMIDEGKIAVAEQSEIHNMHCHSFFSYNRSRSARFPRRVLLCAGR